MVIDVVNGMKVAVLHCFFAMAVMAQDGAKPVQSAEKTEKKAEEKKSADGPGKSAEWAKNAEPGEFHQKLEPLVGEFVGVSSYWSAPDAEPTKSRAFFRRKWVLGGRFLQEEYVGEVFGSKVNSLGMIGYDNKNKKYVSAWFDTMDTGMETMDGEIDVTGKVLSFTEVHTNPATQKTETMRYVFRMESSTKHIIEMYTQDDKGKEFKTLETVCTMQ
ncbi:MAG: DUF1579 family protein [Planctomycetota bacterium]